MKSLLQSNGSSLVVGLHTRAFLIQNDKVIELQENEADTPAPDPNKTRDPKFHDEFNRREVQCVAIATDKSGGVWCAVSRYGKSLSLYLNGELKVSHTTPKRSACLTFAWEPLGMIIAGDLVGDATAFPLDTKSKGRLMLGHTASMLTEVKLLDGHTLLTADRDEIVRISEFPQTTIVKGYLMGHTAFLCSMDPSSKDVCVTCGGDETVRLWNTNTFELLSTKETPDMLPMQLSADGERVAVIFHNSNTIHIYSITDLELLQTIECSAQPLGVSLQQESTMYVLAKEPTLLAVYKLESGKYESTTAVEPIASLNKTEVTMPSSILETDKNGDLKLVKMKETRGGGGSEEKEVPWHRAERVETHNNSRKRRNKRRKEASEAS